MVVPAAGAGPIAWSALVMVAKRQAGVVTAAPEVPLPVAVLSFPLTGSTK
jgi:hypothetical protein